MPSGCVTLLKKYAFNSILKSDDEKAFKIVFKMFSKYTLKSLW